MIIDKKPLPRNPDADAQDHDPPPAYDELRPGPSSVQEGQPRSNPAHGKSSSLPSRGRSHSMNAPLPPLPFSGADLPRERLGHVSPYLQLSPHSSLHLSPNTESSESSISSKWKEKASAWFPFGQATRAAKEVRTTVAGILKDVVNMQDNGAWPSVLQSCVDMCKMHRIPLSDLLQEKSVEGHTPIYWAIVKRPHSSEQTEEKKSGLVTAMLALADPLSDATMSDLYSACVDASDAALFQELRSSPVFARLSGAERLLLESSAPPDDVHVRDVAGHEGGFVVWIYVRKFQRRMRVSKLVHVEFLARGRIWQLKFVNPDKKESHAKKNYDKGRWLVLMSLLEPSPPTWLDSRLFINDSATVPKAKVIEYYPSISPAPSNKQSVDMRLKTAKEQLCASTSQHIREICVPLDETPLGNSLQFDGNSLLGDDGSLRARLEAKLIKPQSDCIIC